MRARIIDAQALRGISPQSLRAYARAEGWVATERYGEHSQVFIKEGAGEAIIPGTVALGDYASVVAELLALFARAENRDELQVYRDLATADRDLVRVRAPQAEADGSVVIEAGVDLVVYSRDLVLSAACSAWDPRPSYRAGKVKQADDYMTRVRLGQTEQGSFVVTLLAPVPPALEAQTTLWPDELEEPYERRVTRRLASGLDAAAQAIEKHNLGGAGISVFEDAVQRGVSANLCAAAAYLSEQGSGIELSITWARTRPTPRPRWMRSFTRSEGEMLAEVARIFLERQPRPDEQIEGVVVKLARETGQTKGRVTMRAVIDNQWTSIQTVLEPDDYEIANQAHLARAPITISGTLERVGQRWRLTSPTGLRRVDEDIDDAGGLS